LINDGRTLRQVQPVDAARRHRIFRAMGSVTSRHQDLHSDVTRLASDEVVDRPAKSDSWQLEVAYHDDNDDGTADKNGGCQTLNYEFTPATNDGLSN
jgi:hypothetical protein